MNCVHLDIKPSNFLVSSEGNIKLGDFGNCFFIGEESTFVEGDSRYIAPELLNISAAQLNSSADLFSLGLSFFELLFNVELPSEGTLWHELRQGFDLNKVPLEQCWVEELDPLMISLIAQLLSPEPSTRGDVENIFYLFEPFRLKLEELKQDCYKSILC